MKLQDKKVPDAKGQQPSQQRDGQLRQFKHAVVQSKRVPVAPQVYRPQPLPRVLQTKQAESQSSSARQSPRRAVAPPVYRPQAKLMQPLPKVLDTKLPRSHQLVPQSKQVPTAPPVYRPQPTPTALQRKGVQTAAAPTVQPLHRNHLSPSEFRTIQRHEVKYDKYFPYTLNGGYGVSVVKNVKGGHHVSITHKAANLKTESIEITGFHFTYKTGSHIYWNHDAGNGHFTHSSSTGVAIPGNQAYITDKVFLETQKVARNCGCTISDQRVPPPPPVVPIPAPAPALPVPGPALAPVVLNDAW